tara:strand:+ start:262 stop:480 length:219 start_codon:yes stop_codon:yes gene_type:complete
MGDEVNAVLQVYQSKLSTLLAQTIALEAKNITLNKRVKELEEQFAEHMSVTEPHTHDQPETPVPPVDTSEGD